jgi:hypothetical protein
MAITVKSPSPRLVPKITLIVCFLPPREMFVGDGVAAEDEGELDDERKVEDEGVVEDEMV